MRQAEYSDAAFILALVNEPGWIQYIGDRNIHSHQDAINYIQVGMRDRYETQGFGLWVVCLKELNKPIGICGLLQRDFLDHPDIGFAFMKKYGGKGYAIEAASKILEIAQSEYSLSHLYAITNDDNYRSQRLLIKLGMNLIDSQFQGNHQHLYEYRSSVKI